MTSEIQMKQSSENSMEDVDSEKQEKIKEKLKDMGVMPSQENEIENDDPAMTEADMSEPDTTRPRRFSPVIVVVILAFSTAGVLAYTFMSEEVNQLLLLNEASEDIVSKNGLNKGGINSNNATEVKAFNNPNMGLQNNDYRASLDQYREQSQRNHNEWLASQRAEFDKRRAEFLKRNSAYQYNQPEYTQPGINQQEINNQQVYKQPQWATSAPPEPPQWVKDRQAEIEKQRAQYLQEIKLQQENRYNNRYNPNYGGNQRPEYFNNPRMNTYQSQQQRPVQTNQPQQPEANYQQGQRQYYRAYNNAPSYRSNPYYAPNGWQGRSYR